MQDTEIFHLRAEAHHPWHLYVGVVLADKDGKIAVVKDPDGTYVLPRETVATDDSLVRLVHKLVLEQIGVVPEVRMYLGSNVIPFDRYDGTKTEKTILYFKATFESPYHEQFAEGPVMREGVEWLPLTEAEERLLAQPWGEQAILVRLSGYP